MKRSILETVLGAIVIVGAAVFLVFSYTTASIKKDVSDGYDVIAKFSSIGGLVKGDMVTISGVQVGSVRDISLDQNTYNARVVMNVRKDVKIPIDSSASISSASLLGGNILKIQPGAEEAMMENEGEIEYTQAPQSLEELLGKFIFSVTEKKDQDAGAAGTAAPVADATQAQ